MGEACEEFIRLIEAGDYYEAHEVLEEVWFPKRFERDDEIFLIKGFINASVAFELHRRGRIEPAKKTWQVYLKYRPMLNRLSESENVAIYRRVDNLLKRLHEDLFGA